MHLQLRHQVGAKCRCTEDLCQPNLPHMASRFLHYSAGNVRKASVYLKEYTDNRCHRRHPFSICDLRLNFQRLHVPYGFLTCLDPKSPSDHSNISSLKRRGSQLSHLSMFWKYYQGSQLTPLYCQD